MSLQQRQAAAQEFQIILNKVEDIVIKLCDTVIEKATVPDLQTMESLEQHLIAQASAATSMDKDKVRKAVLGKTMVQRQQEQRMRMRLLKRDLFEQSTLADFVRLVDHMAVEYVFRNCIWAVRDYYNLERQIQEKKPMTYQVVLGHFVAGGGGSLEPQCLRVKGSEKDLQRPHAHFVALVPQGLFQRPPPTASIQSPPRSDSIHSEAFQEITASIPYFLCGITADKQGYTFAKTLASLASGLALALASKFPIIPKGLLWEWFSANGV